MSLWSESLSNCLYDSENEKDRLRCIVSHLSMQVPRSWWEMCVNNERYVSEYAGVLADLYQEVQESEEFKWVDHSLLLALGYIDDQRIGNQPEFGSVYSQYPLDEYFERAKVVLEKRPDLKELAKKMASVRKFQNHNQGS